MWYCRLLGWWYSLRYAPKDMFKGRFFLGHDFEYRGEVHEDHWHLHCRNCELVASIDTHPEKVLT